MPDNVIPEDPGDRAALYRSMLADRRVLVLLDNARDTAQLRPLLPGGTSAVLITSRTPLAGYRVFDLDLLKPAEALTMFTRIVGIERVTAEQAAAVDTVAACGYLPLAVRTTANRLAARPKWPVSCLQRE